MFENADETAEWKQVMEESIAEALGDDTIVCFL